ncbi:hypothetical protein OH77DRAFT_1432641 [Trametes cingulata]|nr:hypothetical protein OH77DRAFT_1432641 [Trametes cingulata]
MLGEWRHRVNGSVLDSPGGIDFGVEGPIIAVRRVGDKAVEFVVRNHGWGKVPYLAFLAPGGDSLAVQGDLREALVRMPIGGREERGKDEAMLCVRSSLDGPRGAVGCCVYRQTVLIRASSRLWSSLSFDRPGPAISS